MKTTSIFYLPLTLALFLFSIPYYSMGENSGKSYHLEEEGTLSKVYVDNVLMWQNMEYTGRETEINETFFLQLNYEGAYEVNHVLIQVNGENFQSDYFEGNLYSTIMYLYDLPLVEGENSIKIITDSGRTTVDLILFDCRRNCGSGSDQPRVRTPDPQKKVSAKDTEPRYSGIDGENETQKLTISPNPVGDFLSITLPERTFDKVSLFNVKGQEMNISYKAKLLGNVHLISIETVNLPIGIYFLQIVGEDNSYQGSFLKK